MMIAIPVLRNFCSVFKHLAIILGLFSALVQGQGEVPVEIKSAKNVLQRIQQLGHNQALYIEDQNQLLKSYRLKLSGAKNDQLQAEQDLQLKKQQAYDFTQLHKLKPSSTTQRQLNQAQHGWKIAQRVLRSRVKRYRRIAKKLQRVESESEQGRLKLASLRLQEKRQSAYILNLQRAQTLKLADVAAAKQARSAAAVSAKAAERRVAAQRLEAEVQAQLQAVSRAESKSAALPTAKPEAKVATKLKVDLASLDKQALVQAQREEARLRRLLAKRKTVKPIFKSLLLRSSRMSPVKFSHLGNNMYRVEAMVAAGKQLFEVASTDFRTSIPDADDGEWYVFIYDARRASRGRLSMYKRSLL